MENLPMSLHVLVVDDDRRLTQTLVQQIEALGFKADAAHTGAAARRMLETAEYALVLLDLSLPDVVGIELLREWRERYPQLPVIMISGTATIPQAVDAMKLGVADFLIKPVDMDLLQAVLQRTVTALNLQAENLRLKTLTQGEPVEFLGQSPVVKSLLSEAAKIAASDKPALLEGETGTGKQVLARFIHARSPRAAEPFVTVNCAAITETLFESELFGHEKGAFTGAISRKPGKLELVGKGSLFLDEIGELPVNCQAKLLTAVEDRSYERVGGLRPLTFEGRVIAATNRRLDVELEKGSFRRDLFFRLSGFRLHLPPLRNRAEDIPLFVSLSLERCRRKYGRDFEPPDADTQQTLQRYAWPGNVRECLQHVERAALLSDGERIPRSLWLAFPPSPTAEAETSEDLRCAVESFRKRHILGVLARCAGNQTEAAKRLGIERTHLNRVLAEFEGRK
jgi:DNA-binding NtrC family response regulator